MSEPEDDLRAEYDASDLGEGVRGKHYEAFQRGTNLVLLDPDVAQAFPSADSVNDALRLLMRVAKSTA